MLIKKAFLLPALCVLAATLQAQSSQKITGTVSDAMCGKKHMREGASAAKCTRACVKNGSDYALVVGDKVCTLKGDKAQIDKFAGANVVIEGETNGDIITVNSIKGAQ